MVIYRQWDALWLPIDKRKGEQFWSPELYHLLWSTGIFHQVCVHDNSNGQYVGRQSKDRSKKTKVCIIVCNAKLIFSYLKNIFILINVSLYMYYSKFGLSAAPYMVISDEDLDTHIEKFIRHNRKIGPNAVKSHLQATGIRVLYWPGIRVNTVAMKYFCFDAVNRVKTQFYILILTWSICRRQTRRMFIIYTRNNHISFSLNYFII
jgi:hypothetical protein